MVSLFNLNDHIGNENSTVSHIRFISLGKKLKQIEKKQDDFLTKILSFLIKFRKGFLHS